MFTTVHIGYLTLPRSGYNHKVASTFQQAASSKHRKFIRCEDKLAFIIVGAIVNIYSPFTSVYYTQKNNKHNSTSDKIGSQQYWKYVRYINSSQIEVKYYWRPKQPKEQTVHKIFTNRNFREKQNQRYWDLNSYFGSYYREKLIYQGLRLCLHEKPCDPIRPGIRL